MTDQRDVTANERPSGDAQERVGGAAGLLNRRAVLQGVTATLPTILTLNSGAALARARSSNLISTVRRADGDALCLDPRSTQGPTRANPNVYDLGSPAYGEVTRIPLSNTYHATDRPWPLRPEDVCRYRGKVTVNRGAIDAREVMRTPGVLVSNAAVASCGTSIVTTDI